MAAEICNEYQANRRTDDFRCTKRVGHTDCHIDPDTGTQWGHGPPTGIVKKRG
jgi:hypothetical protein